MNLLSDTIAALTEELAAALAALPESERIEALNSVRRRLHEISPFHDEPVDLVEWIPADKITPNGYNPNAVAPPEMRLLARSIRQDGYTQPVVTYRTGEKTEIVDGFHRYRVATENPVIRARVKGYIPCTAIRSEQSSERDRMAATIRHNRARGVHGVMPMTDVVASLIRAGWNDDEIARELGMDADEVLRFKQTKGLPELFKGSDYSKSWE